MFGSVFFKRKRLVVSNIIEVGRSIYAFGSPCDKIFGHMVLLSDGTIFGYNHPNEVRYKFEGENLVFLNEKGEITSRYKKDNYGNWFGTVEGKKYPLFLIRILSLEPNMDDAVNFSVFINSVPKSGTYFLEKAFTFVGLKPTRIHVSGCNIVDDYRGLKDEETHVNPEAVRLIFPIELLFPILKGEILVGHVEYEHIVRIAKKFNILVINLVRNLRSVLASLFAFKKFRVKSVDSVDNFWKRLPENKQFEAFLVYYAHRDVAHIKAVAENIYRLKHEFITLKYEDLVSKTLPTDVCDQLNKFTPHLCRKLEKAIEFALFKKTPTYIGKRINWQDIWNAQIEEFFHVSGLYELNRKLGYES